MKILFICGCMEPGKDGVGDYTRRLAGELAHLNQEVLVLALRDRFVQSKKSENQNVDGELCRTIRLPADIPVKKALDVVRDDLETFRPEWVSLQFVLYGFDPKGLPFGLPGTFSAFFRDVKWHIMFHETYIDGGKILKNKAVSKSQILILRRLVKKLNPRVVHTSIPVYRNLLNRIGIRSDLLGLFGNIKIIGDRNSNSDVESSVLSGVFFGASPNHIDVHRIVKKISQFTRDNQKSIRLTFCGKDDGDRKVFIRLIEEESDNRFLSIIDRGEMSGDDLSAVFLDADFGIARNVPGLLGKSGAALAMLEHGLPLFVPMAENAEAIRNAFDFRSEQCFHDLKDLDGARKNITVGSRLPMIANQFLHDLQAAHAEEGQIQTGLIKNYRILFLTHKFFPDVGGIEVNSEVLAIEFHKAGHDVRLATWSENSDEDSFPFPVYRAPHILQLFKLHRWADLVFENNPCLRLAWPGILFRTPFVVALCTWIARVDGQIAWQDKLKQWWLSKASGVIVVSEAVRQKCWAEATVIANPYRDQIFRITEEVRSPLGFVFLGRLVSDKGTNRAIDAIAKIINDNEIKGEVKLTVIGDGPEMNNLRKQVEALNIASAVHFTGVLKGESLIAALNQHSYMLVPSLWEEPFGNVALEGMACGCLPIVSSNGGLPDAVGNAGILFNPHEEYALYDAIKKVLINVNYADELRDAAAGHLEKHRPDRIAAQYLEAITFFLKNVKK